MTKFMRGVAIALSAAYLLWGEECAVLPEQKGTELLQYIKERYSFPATAHLTLMTNVLVTGTCYRKLVVGSDNPKRTFNMYLSPDLRFLSPVIMDTTVDPKLERRIKAAETARLLSRTDVPAIGDRDSPSRLSSSRTWSALSVGGSQNSLIHCRSLRSRKCGLSFGSYRWKCTNGRERRHR